MGIHILPLTVQFDGKVWVDHQELGSEELFKRVAKGAAMPSTQPPTVEAYCANLEELLQKHEHVFAVHISHKLSQTVEHAQQAAQAFAGRVTVVDAYNSSGALAMQAQRASRLLTQQIAPEQVKVLLELLRPQVSTRMCLNTMSYLHKNGRIGGATALLGGWLNIKPIVGLQDGKVEAFGRPLGAPRALKQMAGLVEEYAAITPHCRMTLFHNGNEEGVAELRYVARRLQMPVPPVLQLGTVLSAHGGPGVFGFSIEPITVWHNYRPFS